MKTRTRWVVQAADGTSLAEVLVRAGADADAVEDGRVFVGRRRAVTADEGVKPGDEVFVAPVTAPTEPATLLLQEDGLVAADKPADVTTIPDQGGAATSLLASVASTLGVDPRTLHPTSRLDRGVSGVVMFAATEAAATRLRVAREHGVYLRRYVAVALSAPAEPHGAWTAPIGRAKEARHRAVSGPDAVPAHSRYATVARAGSWALLALEPVTGRTHQLRVHAAHAGAPLLGDRVYGGPSRLTLASGSVVSFDRIALHAARVRVPRPDGSMLEVCSPVPRLLREWWRLGGGDDGAWDAALGDDLTALRG